MLRTLPKTHITIAAVATAVVTAAILMSPSSDVEAKRMSFSLNLEQGSASDSASAEIPSATAQPSVSSANGRVQTLPDNPAQPTLSSKPKLDWQTFSIKPGDTLSSLFKKAGFTDGIMLSVIHGENDAKKLQHLYAGETIRFATSGGNLTVIELQRSQLESLEIRKTDEGFSGETVIRKPEARPAFTSGIIDDSLYLAAQDAGLTDRLTMELAGIFGWNIDFVYDIRKGDSFEVVYEELYLDGEKFNTGKILSARFINRGEENFALLYTDSNGDSDYYSPDGKSMRKAFLRTPINGRVSSPFNLQRRHPILDVVRPHEGTDYGAPTGTPIKAAGAGRVISAGRKGGYGRTVVLQHGDNITTLYAHMSRLGKGIKRGTRVKQGQTIGYVGSSGMATGPHLHYEFRINGSPRNSRTVELPDAKPIPTSEIARFKRFTEQRVAQFDALHENQNQLVIARGK